MNILFWEHITEEDTNRTPKYEIAATIGVFDGFHVGHRKLLRHLMNSPYDVKKCVITFLQNPAKILQNRKYLGDITTYEQKKRILQELNIDLVVFIDFSQEFSQLTGEKFINFIRKKFSIKHLVLGKDFRCGYQAETDANDVKRTIRTASTRVDIIPPVIDNIEPISSTRIRKEIKRGIFKEVTYLLGRDYAIDLRTGSIDWETAMRDTNNEMSIQKTSITQVLPDKGEFKTLVTLANNSKEFTTITILQEELILHNIQSKNIEEIRFINHKE